MPPKKTPTSSLSRMGLLVNRVRYRGQVTIQRMRSGDDSTEEPAILVSPVSKLPQEMLEMIIAHLRYDMSSLRSCTLTSFAWYIAAVGYLHRPLLIDIEDKRRKLRWPNALRSKRALGLLPFVQDFRIYGNDPRSWISPKLFNWRILQNFRALTNVRELRMRNLDIGSLKPRIRRYFGQFLPTVRFLSLASPKGSNREIIFFIGLFEHLEDLMLSTDTFCSDIEQDPNLTPPSIPPLQGRLIVWRLGKAKLLREMINLFGGIQFSGLDIFDVAETQLLLRSCAKTLRTIQLHPTDPRGNTSLAAFDLSRCKSLQRVEITANSIDTALGSGSEHASKLLKTALISVQPSLTLKVEVVYQETHFRGVQLGKTSKWPHTRYLSRAEETNEASSHRQRFELLRALHKVRDFQLVLCANVWDPVGDYALRMLKDAIAKEKAERGFNDFFSEPLITYNPHWDSRL